jgi:hypothetical protein
MTKFEFLLSPKCKLLSQINENLVTSFFKLIISVKRGYCDYSPWGPKYITDSRYKKQCNFIYAHKKCTAFRTPIFTKLTNAQQHFVHIFYCISWKSDKTNGKSPSPYVKTAFHCTHFHETHNSILISCGHLPYPTLN